MQHILEYRYTPPQIVATIFALEWRTGYFLMIMFFQQAKREEGLLMLPYGSPPLHFPKIIKKIII